MSLASTLTNLLMNRPRPVEVAPPTRGPFRTDRLILRLPMRRDTKQFARVLAASRAHITSFFPLNCDGETDIHYIARQIERAEQGEQDGLSWRRLAFLPTGQIVGAVNINRIERGLDWQADMNWWVAKEWTHRGLGAEMVAAATRYALGDLPEGLGLHRVYAAIHPDNDRSVRLAERVGFTAEAGGAGKLEVNGQWDNHESFVQYAVVGEPAIRAA